MNSVYLRLELRRALRNRRFYIFTFGFPLGLYYLIAAPNRHTTDLSGSGLSAPLYYMVGLAAFGSMNAMLSAGARIAGERSVGWNRQLRITPLTTKEYFRAKIVSAYLVASMSLGLLYIAGATLGVGMPAGRWVHMTWLMLIGLLPFAALGILLGHLVAPDSIGPVMGGSTALFAFVGGVWFPIGSGTMHTIAECIPSFWLVQASHVSLGGSGWSGKGWLVTANWTVGAAALAARAYRRDTKRS